MSNSKILYDNRFRDAVPVASGSVAGTLARNIADARPYTWWRPPALPAILTVDCDTAKAADATCIVAHNLASMGCDVQIRGSTDGFSASDVLVASVTPSTDGPVWAAFASVSYRYWRLRIDGPGTPSLDYDFAGTKTLPAGVTFARADASTCASYFDSAGVLRLAAANVARFDHHPISGESLGLVVEESRTNLLPRSAEFDHASWLKSRLLAFGSGSVANAVTAPDGTVAADKIVEDTATGGHYIYANNVTVTANTAYTASVFVRAAERTKVRVELVDGTDVNGAGATFDISGGSLVSSGVIGSGSAVSAVITPCKDGWYRCALTCVIDAASTAADLLIYTVNAAGSASYAGDGVSGLYVWGAQLERGAFATSHIPTVAAAVTRAADSATVTGANFTSWYTAGVGTLYSDFRVSSDSSASIFPRSAEISDGTTGNRIGHFVRTLDDKVGVAIYSASALQHESVVVSYTYGQAVRVALGFASNDAIGYTTGTSMGADASVTVPTVNKLSIGSDGPGTVGTFLNGTIARLTYWPKRLNNAQLAWLTAADRGAIVEPSIAIAIIGAALTLPTGLEAPFDPIGRKLDGRRIDNNNGQPLGSLVDYSRWEQSITLRAVSWSWVRSTWLPAFNAALQSEPFIFCWDPANYPDEARLVTTDGDFSTPHRSGSLTDLTVNLRGVA